MQDIIGGIYYPGDDGKVVDTETYTDEGEFIKDIELVCDDFTACRIVSYIDLPLGIYEIIPDNVEFVYFQRNERLRNEDLQRF